MIDIHHKSHSNMLFTQVYGMFTQEAFDQAFVHQADEIIAEFQFINIILELNDNLSSWQSLVIWRRFKLYIAPYADISKLAVVCDNRVLSWRFFIPQHQPSMMVERFSYKEIEKAKAWLAIS